MDDQIDPGDNFFGINLSDCVTVAANSPSNAKAIHRAMAFVAEQASQSSGLQGIDQQAIAQGWNNALQAIPIMDSIVGLKAANAHLTRQLAAQALAHAEQMEGVNPTSESIVGSRSAAIAHELESMYDPLREVVALSYHIDKMSVKDGRIAELEIACDEYDGLLASRGVRIAELESQLAMRVTPATQPTDAQQTASDVKAAPERRPDGTLKPRLELSRHALNIPPRKSRIGG